MFLCRHTLHGSLDDVQQDDSKEEENIDIACKEQPLPTFTPDYFAVYTSVKALGLDSKSKPSPGFHLLEKRVEKDIEKFSKRTMKKYINCKKNRWKRDKQFTHERMWPFKPTQIKKKKALVA